MLSSAFNAAILAMSLFTSTISASPTWGQPKWPQHPNPRSQSPNLSNLKMPENSLPTPTGLQLKFVGLGIGTQNYTCSANGTATPASIGALGKFLSALFHY